MPVCIECCYPIKVLYTEYKAADDRSLGRGVRLTQCPRCKLFADKYVEHDFVVLFIDLVLIKPQVYRHLLFNRLKNGKQIAPAIWRLGLLLLLFDVYLTWWRIERVSLLLLDSTKGDVEIVNFIARQPILAQYAFFLTLCATAVFLSHLVIRLLAHYFVISTAATSSLSTPAIDRSAGATPIIQHGIPSPTPLPLGLQTPALASERAATGSAISTSLIISSTPQLFPILMVIWDYDIPAAAEAVKWAVVLNNVEALEILLGCGYGMAALLAVTGTVVRGISLQVILKYVELEDSNAAVAVTSLGEWIRGISG